MYEEVPNVANNNNTKGIHVLLILEQFFFVENIHLHFSNPWLLRTRDTPYTRAATHLNPKINSFKMKSVWMPW